jgi:hypothetical protein
LIALELALEEAPWSFFQLAEVKKIGSVAVIVAAGKGMGSGLVRARLAVLGSVCIDAPARKFWARGPREVARARARRVRIRSVAESYHQIGGEPPITQGKVDGHLEWLRKCAHSEVWRKG